MHAKSARGKLHQRIDVVAFELAGGDHFFKLFFHRNNLNSRIQLSGVHY